MDFKTIFSEGKKEWRRRRSISQDNSILKSKETLLSNRMTDLGRRAWSEAVDMDAFPELKEKLGKSQSEIDELKKKSDECQNQLKQKEEEKKRENERCSTERQGVEEKKKEADLRLGKEKDRLKELQKELSQSENRNAEISREREKIQNKIADAATSSEQRAEHEKHLLELSSEETDLLARRRSQNEEIAVQNNRITPIQEEVNTLQQQINDITSKQKESISEIEKGINGIKKEEEVHQQKIRENENVMTDLFRRLGEGLSSLETIPSCLNMELAAVRETEAEISVLKGNIADLDSQRSDEGSRAYRMMLTLVIGGALLLIAVVVLLLMLLSPKKDATLQNLVTKNPMKALNQVIAKAAAEEASDPAKGMEALQQGITGIRRESEKKIGEGTPVASQEQLSRVLAELPGWTMTPADYSSSSYSDIETAMLRSTYQRDDNQTIQLEITDTHSASALLIPVQAGLSLNMTVDNEEVYQKSGRYNGFPMMEHIDKQEGSSRLLLVINDRYIVKLETEVEAGLDLLKKLAGRLNLKYLQ